MFLTASLHGLGVPKSKKVALAVELGLGWNTVVYSFKNSRSGTDPIIVAADRKSRWRHNEYGLWAYSPNTLPNIRGFYLVFKNCLLGISAGSPIASGLL